MTPAAAMAPAEEQEQEQEQQQGKADAADNGDASSPEVTKSSTRRKRRDSSSRHKDRDRDREADEEEQHSRRSKHRDREGSRHRHHHRSSRYSRSPSSGDGGGSGDDFGERSGSRRSSSHRERDRDRDRERSRYHRRSRHSSRRRHRHSRSRSRSEENNSNKKSSPKERSRSPSKPKSPERSRSRSRSESKRASGFDVLPSGVPALVPQAGGMMLPYPMQSTMTQQATRHARRVYVGGLPPLVNEQGIAAFFNQVMENVGGNTFAPGDSVVNVYINQEKRFAFVEMRSVEEASNAMALDGIFFNGIQVRIRRPSDYDQDVASRLGPTQPSPYLNLGAVGLQYRSFGPADGPDRIFVGGLPYDWGEDDLRKYMEAFGPVRGLEIIKDAPTGNSKGYGFVVYSDPTVTDTACSVLNEAKVGDKQLTVRRATPNGQPKPEGMLLLPQQQHIIHNESDIPTKVVCLSNAVSVEELEDDAVFKEIHEDMIEECVKYGELRKVEIPRQSGAAGVGKVFLEYKDVTSSIRAKCALGGRKFAGNTVEARYYPEHRFAAADYGC